MINASFFKSQDDVYIQFNIHTASEYPSRYFASAEAIISKGCVDGDNWTRNKSFVSITSYIRGILNSRDTHF